MCELVINLNALKNNYSLAKRLLNNNQKICIVAKANCYGLGAKKICSYFDDCTDYFAVSSTYEFLQIKKYVTKPILILDPIYENITKSAKLGAELTVSNFESLKAIEECASKNKIVIYKVHIAVNTGMNRFGFCEIKEINKVLKVIQKTQNIIISGVFTHFYKANDDFFSKNQYLKFCEVVKFVLNKLHDEKVVFHICNSDGFEKNNCFDMVRLGMFLYADEKFQTVTLKSKILDFQNLKINETAGYGGIFKAKKLTRLAVVGIGYADGLFRSIYKKGYVLINGNRAKIVAVCMDSILVDVTNISCKIYDDVILIGRSGNEQIFICDVANWCDTIGYEIISRISGRVKRKYIG